MKNIFNLADNNQEDTVFLFNVANRQFKDEIDEKFFRVETVSFNKQLTGDLYLDFIEEALINMFY